MSPLGKLTHSQQRPQTDEMSPRSSVWNNFLKSPRTEGKNWGGYLAAFKKKKAMTVNNLPRAKGIGSLGERQTFTVCFLSCANRIFASGLCKYDHWDLSFIFVQQLRIIVITAVTSLAIDNEKCCNQVNQTVNVSVYTTCTPLCKR